MTYNGAIVRMYISRVSLQGIRSFRKLSLDLVPRSETKLPTARLHTLLIGENGTGKTTLLRAIAVGLADRSDASGLLSEPTGQFVAEGKKRANITIDVVPRSGRGLRETLRTAIASQNGQDVLERTTVQPISSIGLVCGYGISRAVEGSDSVRNYRVIDSVYSLFQYEQTLIPAELTLRRLRDFLGSTWYPLVLDKIKNAMGLDSSVSIDLPKGGGVRISGETVGRDIPLAGWADGYRKTLAWILDLYGWAMRANCVTKTGNVQGIALIDEIEQHLHPAMQVRLFSRLSDLLPHVQIIATTHSPLVAMGVAPDELVVLKRQGDTVVAHEFVTDFQGYSVEDMFADPRLFGSETHTPASTEKLLRYRKLASKPRARRSKKEQIELRTLASWLAGHRRPEAQENPALSELQKILQKYNL